MLARNGREFFRAGTNTRRLQEKIKVHEKIIVSENKSHRLIIDPLLDPRECDAWFDVISLHLLKLTR